MRIDIQGMRRICSLQVSPSLLTPRSCGCDVPSHAYTFNFALYPDWPRYFSHAPDIWEYLNKVVTAFDLRKYMTFNTEAVGAWWQEDKGQWKVKLRQTVSDVAVREFETECDVLLYGVGFLNNYKWPDIEGLENFKGKAHFPVIQRMCFIC
jgi:hydroxyversicolorone monooxygenase